MHFLLRRLPLPILLCLAVGAASGQKSTPIVIPKLTGEIRIDGMSDELAWQAVAPWIPTQYEPDNGAPVTEKTEFLVAYDDEYVYFALRAYDRNPDGIRANTLYRDRLSGDDHFEILLDTFNDNETALLFTTTPAGIRKDALIFNDASGGGIRSGGWINGDFNTYWDVETTVNTEGWFAEIRVPVSSLRFQEEERGVIMGITLQRKIARKTERAVFPAVTAINNWAFLKPSQAQKILLRGLRSKRPLYVTGYGLGGLDRVRDSTSALGATYESGFDVKYGLTDNLTLDVTLNTDFAQAEADDQQVNLTRFSLFYPEKRQFFQERSGIFDFRVGRLSRLFHSRRIGLTEDGTPVSLWGGTRLVGRTGLWDVGLLNMQTRRSGNLPSENFGVLRLRRRVWNEFSYAGAMATSRLGPDGRYNLAYGFDAVARLRGDDYLAMQWAQSFDDMLASDVNGLNNGRFTIELERRRRSGWGYRSAVAWAGRLYDPGVGFTQRNNFTLLDDAVSYTWLMPESSRLIWHRHALQGFAFVRNANGTVESAEVGPEWDFAAKNGSGGKVAFKVLLEDLEYPFALSGEAQIPEGRYAFFQAKAAYHVSHTNLVQLRPEVTAGTFFDGSELSVGASPVWYVSRHLELASSYRYTRIRFPDRGEHFDAHLARIRIGTALNTEVSTNAFVQYNSATHTISANVRFRYNFREGNDLWIVYNTNGYSEGHGVPPGSEALLLKYTYTYQQ